MHAQQIAEEGPRLRKRQLQKIEGALRRIEAGEYGRCFVVSKKNLMLVRFRSIRQPHAARFVSRNSLDDTIISRNLK